MDNTAVKIITYFSNLEEFLIGILFFTIPFGWTFSIVPLVLVTTTLLVNAFTKPQTPSKEKLLYFLPPIAIFVWNAITLFYSKDTSNGISLLTTQLALIVAALAFLFNRIHPSSIQKGFYMFLLGCLSSVALLYGMAMYNSSSIIGDAYIFRPVFDTAKACILDTDINSNYFLGREFSSLVHPAYNALMLSMAMFLILNYVRSDSTALKHRSFWLIAFAVFGVVIIQFSLNGALILMGIIILMVLGILSVRKIYYAEYSRIIYGILLIFIAFLLINPQTRGLAENKTSCSLERRLAVTQASLLAIEKNWLLGAGIGDDSEVMHWAYMKLGKNELAEKNYNSHNQFLTTWLQSGIIGFLLLIWSFVSVSIRAQRKKIMLLHIFNVMVIVSFLFESMLMRYWGVITYVIFYSMLYFYSDDKEIEDKIEMAKYS